jgi:hypothetical protein
VELVKVRLDRFREEALGELGLGCGLEHHLEQILRLQVKGKRDVLAGDLGGYLMMKESWTLLQDCLATRRKRAAAFTSRMDFLFTHLAATL